MHAGTSHVMPLAVPKNLVYSIKLYTCCRGRPRQALSIDLQILVGPSFSSNRDILNTCVSSRHVRRAEDIDNGDVELQVSSLVSRVHYGMRNDIAYLSFSFPES